MLSKIIDFQHVKNYIQHSMHIMIVAKTAFKNNIETSCSCMNQISLILWPSNPAKLEQSDTDFLEIIQIV